MPVRVLAKGYGSGAVRRRELPLWRRVIAVRPPLLIGERGVGLSRPSEHLLTFFQLGLKFRRGEIDRVFKLVSASFASPDVTNAAGGQVFRPLRCNDVTTTLRAWAHERRRQHGTLPHVPDTSLPAMLSRTHRKATLNTILFRVTGLNMIPRQSQSEDLLLNTGLAPRPYCYPSGWPLIASRHFRTRPFAFS